MMPKRGIVTFGLLSLALPTSTFLVSGPLKAPISGGSATGISLVETTSREDITWQGNRCLSTRRLTEVPLELAGDPGSWRQYVPLVASGFVLVDMLSGAVTGNSVANSITRAMKQSVAEAQEAEALSTDGVAETGGRNQERRPVAGDAGTEPGASNARVDTESIAKDALQKAENALLAVQLVDERRPKKGSIEDLKRKLDQELG
mmetsp:Transcript_14480/g.25354  ORF Transcript_14480/g.25354 Transcript_14480/m.25354 type:complete len:204 (+) Transcript_14480:156-767(+)|eukprot:CAMPEP_0205911022 /NCGR_PEP_ID=MMETSP1325-20131115/4854_1 /ASSEMBLY_ACC=CAM_ASM_000708 /TAXON_ID=236786 /ORGANISM="Florenciella sp., Strain RCC1007" /LENGTH=203 /DNA_ID=CAMNT_0053277471 /DNA_START=139 /DNA_END=750 /DNA_ORIENTATION=+